MSDRAMRALSSVVLLAALVAPAHANEQLLANPSMEAASDGGGSPAAWSHNAWGDLSAQESWASGDAHDGDRFLRMTITTKSGSDGDAKWWSDEVVIPDGTEWMKATVWYRADVPTVLLVATWDADGVASWNKVRDVPAASAWTETSGVLAVPEGAKTARLMQVLAVPGTLDIDAAALEALTDDPTANLPPPLVSIAFDDGWRSAWLYAVPLMDEYGMPGSHFIHTDFMDKEGFQFDYITVDEVVELAKRGHEVGSHCLHHINLKEASDADRKKHIIDSKARLQEIGIEAPVGFVPPGGDYNDEVRALVEQHYDYLRGVEAGVNEKPYDRYNLKGVVVTNKTNISEIKAWLNLARQTESWLVLLYHRIDPKNPLDTFVSPGQFEDMLELLEDEGAIVKPMGEVLGVWQPQVFPDEPDAGPSAQPDGWSWGQPTVEDAGNWQGGPSDGGHAAKVDASVALDSKGASDPPPIDGAGFGGGSIDGGGGGDSGCTASPRRGAAPMGGRTVPWLPPLALLATLAILLVARRRTPRERA